MEPTGVDPDTGRANPPCRRAYLWRQDGRLRRSPPFIARTVQDWRLAPPCQLSPLSASFSSSEATCPLPAVPAIPRRDSSPARPPRRPLPGASCLLHQSQRASSAARFQAAALLRPAPAGARRSCSVQWAGYAARTRGARRRGVARRRCGTAGSDAGRLVGALHGAGGARRRIRPAVVAHRSGRAHAAQCSSRSPSLLEARARNGTRRQAVRHRHWGRAAFPGTLAAPWAISSNRLARIRPSLGRTRSAISDPPPRSSSHALTISMSPSDGQALPHFRNCWQMRRELRTQA